MIASFARLGVTVLQRGRARAGAELMQNRSRSRRRARQLQRGRARAGAELQHRRRDGVRQARRFNGAAPARARN